MAYKNEGKEPLHLVSPDFIRDVALCLEMGEDKHRDHHYRDGVSVSQVLAAIKRHIAAIERGEYYDSDSELQHAVCATSGLMILHHFTKNYTGYAEFFDQPFNKEKTMNAYTGHTQSPSYIVLDEDDGDPA
jgi:hypothetical protein